MKASDARPVCASGWVIGSGEVQEVVGKASLRSMFVPRLIPESPFGPLRRHPTNGQLRNRNVETVCDRAQPVGQGEVHPPVLTAQTRQMRRRAHVIGAEASRVQPVAQHAVRR